MYWKFGSLSSACCVVLTSLAGFATYELYSSHDQSLVVSDAIAVNSSTDDEAAKAIAPITSVQATFIPFESDELLETAKADKLPAVDHLVTLIEKKQFPAKAQVSPEQLFENNESSPFYFEQKQPEAFQAARNTHFDAGNLQRAALMHASLQEDWSFFPKELIVPEPYVIVLDPGHGGSDPGSTGHNGLLEKVLTLDIAKRTALFLSEIENIEVKLTRDKDIGLTRTGRVKRVQRSNADLLVSLHLNHIPGSNMNLVETFYAGPQNIAESRQKMREAQAKRGLVFTSANQSPDVSFTQGSRKLAGLMQNRVLEEVSMDNPKVIDAGVKRDTLYILTRSFIPGVLIELSALSNKEEAKRLTDPAYRDRLAAAVADGIRDYLTTPEAKKQYGFGV